MKGMEFLRDKGNGNFFLPRGIPHDLAGVFSK